TMAAEVRRDSFKTFWDKYSDKPDTNSMMLNQTANDLEASDRAEILSSLPILTNKDVVDIGAGIGRFTTVLAETARWVHSTDFIESFIAKNQERNAHLGNISYQIGDAVNLQMEEKRWGGQAFPTVPAELTRSNNWRQVHWLTKKVSADGDEETTINDLLKLFSQTWYAEQVAWDAKLDNEKYVWTDKFRFGWNESLASSIEYWRQRDASFDCLIGTELLSTNDDDSIRRVASIMKPEAKVVLLEPVDDVAEQPIKE
ncbi:hypothetical protein ANCCEY_14916, partial [Ancylostoma ceylanicum]